MMFSVFNSYSITMEAFDWNGIILRWTWIIPEFFTKAAGRYSKLLFKQPAKIQRIVVTNPSGNVTDESITCNEDFLCPI